MPKDKKKHHFVPAVYLVQFADSAGQVAIVRKAAPAVQNRSKPTEVGFRNYYYSQPLPNGRRENNTLENLFSTIESEWPTTASVLTSGQPANGVLPHLLLFIGLQRVRVPTFRESIEQSMEAYARRAFEILKGSGELPPPPPKFPDIADHIQITLDPHQSLHAMARVNNELGPILDSFGYVVVHNRTPVELLTSDNPVAYHLRTRSDDSIIPYSWSPQKDRELVFPISPDALVYGSSKDRDRFANRGLKHVEVRDADQIRRFNRITVKYACDAVFGRSQVPKALVAKYASEVPAIDPEFAGYDPDNIQIPPYVFGPRGRLPKWRD